ncbi:glycosyltransferase [Candidatus Poribacteria bacterium]|nr:glycosyltransferase [Candidatus Poribacteria bacterium]
MLRIKVLTEFPSPHMMDFWDAINRLKEIRLKLFFEKVTVSTKSWGVIPDEIDTEIADWLNISTFDKINWLRKIFSEKADIWVLCDNYNFWENHLIAHWARNYKIPTIYMAERTYWKCRQFTGVKSWRNPLYSFVKQITVPLIIRHFDALACYGGWACEQYNKLNSGSYIFPTEYYVNLDTLRKINRTKKNPDDVVVIGLCGALIPRKGFQYILSNLNLIKSFDNWEIRIAGSGYFGTELKAIIPDNFKPKVKFLGKISNEKMPEFWSEIDILLFPSLFDGWGMVVLEALSAGVPVISGDNVGAAREYIKNGCNGEVRKVDKNFIQALLPLLDNPEKLNILSINARKSVENYSPEIGASNFIKHIKIISKRINTKKVIVKK